MGGHHAFDLLLQLISKHKLEVTELALHQVTDEFIGYIRAQGHDWDLDEATEFPSGVVSTAAWSRAEWVEATLPAWKELVDPVAERVGAAMGDVLPEEMQAMAGPLIGMMRSMGGAMFGTQIGQAVGILGTDLGIGVRHGEHDRPGQIGRAHV